MARHRISFARRCLDAIPERVKPPIMRIPKEELSMRAVCYYPWFPAHWQAVQPDPPLVPNYSSLDPTIVERHFRDMKHARIDVALVSWWGPGSSEAAPMALILAAAQRHGMKVALIHEPLNRTNPTRVRMSEDLIHIRATYGSHAAYLRMGGKPAIFVFTHNDPANVDYPAVWADWWAANANRACWLAMRTAYFPPGDPRTWRNLNPPAFDTWWDYEIGQFIHEGAMPHSMMISPGMHTWDRETPELPRIKSAWEYVTARAAQLAPPITIIVSWNEHEEGTGVEPSERWGTYFIDTLHRS